MKLKADENFEAAKLLITNTMYSTSIHCLYYSCFQLSKFALNKNGITYDDQERLSKGLDSHHYIITETANQIDPKSHLGYLDYNYNMSRLKKMRRKADYTNAKISLSEAEKACSMAESVRKIINSSI